MVVFLWECQLRGFWKELFTGEKNGPRNSVTGRHKKIRHRMTGGGSKPENVMRLLRRGLRLLLAFR